MVDIVPTIGRIVIYTLNHVDAEMIIAQRKKHSDFAGNWPRAGQQFPMMIVAVWGDKPDSYVNGKVMLDGQDTFWASSRKVGTDPGTYHWMEYQKGQAAKTEALEAKIDPGAAA